MERKYMRTGKPAEAVMKRSVLRPLCSDTKQNEKMYGTDGSFLPSEDGTAAVYSAVSTVPGFETVPELYVACAANNLLAAGAVPQALLVQAVIAAEKEENGMKEVMRRIADAAQSFGMPVIGGHTQISDDIAEHQYYLTGIGRSTQQRQEALRPGQELVLTKWIALAGTSALAETYGDELRTRYPFQLIDKAAQFRQLIAVDREARAISHFGALPMHDLSQGGIFGALWEMADYAGVGLEVDLKRIPIRQETVEICEYFDINPYEFYSAGSLLIGTEHAESMVRELEAQGIHAAVIGRVTDTNERVIRNGEDCRYLDRPKQDEWYRFLKERQMDKE